MTMEQSYNKALSYAYQLLNHRPRSEKELIQKLQQKGYTAEIIDRIISLFKKQKLIDDKNFAKLWALSKIQSKPSSLTRIKQQLATKGVDPQVTDVVVAQLKENFDEYEIAKGLAEKKLRLTTGVKKLKAKKILSKFIVWFLPVADGQGLM